MTRTIVLLSGEIASGKSTLCSALETRFNFHVVKTRELIQRLQSVPSERKALQRAGESLDRRTKGEWVGDALGKVVAELEDSRSVIVDSVRIKKQIDSVRRAFGMTRVVHVHLTASRAKREEWYEKRMPHARIVEAPTYAEASSDATESKVARLGKSADVVINTERCSQEDVLVRVASRLGLYGRRIEPLVDVLIGGQYGSEGKGHIAAYLSPEYSFLLRVGGPNAGHKVYGDPPYTHHQLPSGTQKCQAGLIIGPGAVLSVEDLRKEIAECGVSMDRLAIDPRAMIIESADIRFEQKLEETIGSTARGVGAATSRKLLRTAANPPVRLAKDADELRPYIKETLSVLENAFAGGKKVLLEGTQGTGLSLHHGDYPYVTSRDTSGSGCIAEAGIAPNRVRRTVMVIRSYPIRVQSPADHTSGPMGIEIEWDVVASRSGLPVDDLRSKEKTSTTGRKRRVAEFNWSLFRKAIALNSPTDVALTFADYLDKKNSDARRFDQLAAETVQFIEEIEAMASAPVSLISTRFDYRSIIDRRSW